MRSLDRIFLTTLALFAFLQIGVQPIIGENPYIRWSWYEVWTHIIGGVVLGLLMIRLINLPSRFDHWRFWIPLMTITSVMVLGISYELVELIITWFHLMPVTQMYATITNSFLVDLPHDFAGACIAALLWELYKGV